MNPVVVTITVLYFVAGGWDLWKGHPAEATVWLAYAVANCGVLALSIGIK